MKATLRIKRTLKQPKIRILAKTCPKLHSHSRSRSSWDVTYETRCRLVFGSVCERLPNHASNTARSEANAQAPTDNTKLQVSRKIVPTLSEY